MFDDPATRISFLEERKIKEREKNVWISCDDYLWYIYAVIVHGLDAVIEVNVHFLDVVIVHGLDKMTVHGLHKVTGLYF